mmetsp:Transcript_51409/g.102122  ORF Transcript_51409/g.102122 Transcript_51409/m.102122 type:complete len:205 (+) Transcript_51409:44-658(+)
MGACSVKELPGIPAIHGIKTAVSISSSRNPDAYTLPDGSGQLAQRAINDIRLSDAEWKALLSRNEYKILRKKASEPRHSTKWPKGFEDFYQPGVYFCGSCFAAGAETPLYTSTMKFESSHGSPSFWTNVKGNVYEKREKNHRCRSEVLCTRCNGHLGHVFRGEGLFLAHGHPTDERHSVNSTCLVFVPAEGRGVVKPTYKGLVF